jgi:hypothetical protein
MISAAAFGQRPHRRQLRHAAGDGAGDVRDNCLAGGADRIAQGAPALLAGLRPFEGALRPRPLPILIGEAGRAQQRALPGVGLIDHHLGAALDLQAGDARVGIDLDGRFGFTQGRGHGLHSRRGALPFRLVEV